MAFREGDSCPSGARQVGKTSILRLLQNQVQGAPVFYFDLESTFDLAHTATAKSFIDMNHFPHP
jgi:predicted AAA+ superfamily ATPase